VISFLVKNLTQQSLQMICIFSKITFMNFVELFKSKTVKSKERTEQLAHWLMDNPKQINKLVDFAAKSKDEEKATCIESIELATKAQPAIVDAPTLKFIINSLPEKAPRVKWESARVIGNVANLQVANLDLAISPLLKNAIHEGTLVRWSAAYALGEIIKQKSILNKQLLPTIEKLIDSEEKNSIKKIYAQAIKKLSK